MEQHNAERGAEHRRSRDAMLRPQPTGVECPECQRELRVYRGMVYMSDPPKVRVKCECGHDGFMLA